MASGRTIIVGGGISAGSPFTLNAFMYVGQTDPPTALSSPLLFQVTGANPAIVVSAALADPQASTTTAMRVVGGVASFANATANGLTTLVLGARQTLTNISGKTDFIIIGNDANINTPGSSSVYIGRGITQVTGGGGAVTAVGASISVGSGIPDSIVALGNNISVGNMNGGSSGRCVLIGAGITMTGGVVTVGDVVIVGSGSTHGAGGGSNTAVGTIVQLSTATRACGVGRNNVWSAAVDDTGVLGTNNSIQHSSCIILGSGITTTGASQCYIGGTTVGSAGITSVIIGKGDTNSAPSSIVIRATNASGANVAGANVTIRAGLGTGTGVPGQLNFQVSIPTGAGSTLQTAQTPMQITGSLGVAAIITSAVHSFASPNALNTITLSDAPGLAVSISAPGASYTFSADVGQLSAGDLMLSAGGTGLTLGLAGENVGFFGTGPIAQPTVTGSRGGNAALTSLLTQLAALGLIVDGTSA